jgi:hypothetical protein
MEIRQVANSAKKKANSAKKKQRQEKHCPQKTKKPQSTKTGHARNPVKAQWGKFASSLAVTPEIRSQTTLEY